jgi:hypothetical protein
VTRKFVGVFVRFRAPLHYWKNIILKKRTDYEKTFTLLAFVVTITAMHNQLQSVMTAVWQMAQLF